MLHEIIIGASVVLIGAAVTGLTFLAVKYPQGYGKVGSSILIIALSAFVGLVSFWVSGVFSHQERLKSTLEIAPQQPISESAEVIIAITLPFDGFLYWLIGAVALILYLLFLDSLPTILESKQEDDTSAGTT